MMVNSYSLTVFDKNIFIHKIFLFETEKKIWMNLCFFLLSFFLNLR